MMNFIKNVAKIGIGIAIGASITAFATYIIPDVYLNDEILIRINGTPRVLLDETTGERQYPLTYKDRTYIPLRSVATLLGYRVGYNNETKTATIDSPLQVPMQQTTNVPTQVPITQRPITQIPITQAPLTQIPTTQRIVTPIPVATQKLNTQIPITQVPITQAPLPQTSGAIPESTSTKNKTVDIRTIPCVANSRWSDTELDEGIGLLTPDAITNVIGLLYGVDPNRTDVSFTWEDYVHSESPFKNEMGNYLHSIWDPINEAGISYAFSLDRSNFQLKIEKYAYDSSNLLIGAIVTYNRTYKLKYGGETTEDTQQIRAIFMRDNSQLKWLCDIID